MKAFVIIFALAGLAAGYKIQPDKEQLILVPKTGQCDPDMTPCPSGCCPVPPELNWFCCPDAAYPGCAATADDCPFETKRVQLVKFAKTDHDQCGPDETSCPVGCCPMPDWYCCPDHFPICAPTAFDCPWSSLRDRTVDKLFMLWYNISKYITDFETTSIMSFSSLWFLCRQHNSIWSIDYSYHIWNSWTIWSGSFTGKISVQRAQSVPMVRMVKNGERESYWKELNHERTYIEKRFLRRSRGGLRHRGSYWDWFLETCFQKSKVKMSNHGFRPDLAMPTLIQTVQCVLLLSKV